MAGEMACRTSIRALARIRRARSETRTGQPRIAGDGDGRDNTAYRQRSRPTKWVPARSRGSVHDPARRARQYTLYIDP
jgi:hypothetical protein